MTKIIYNKSYELPSASAIAVSDGVTIYSDIQQLTFNGATLTQNGGVIDITISSSGGAIAISDGTNTYSDIEQINFEGATITQQDAIVTISQEMPRNLINAIVLGALTI